MLYFNVKRVLQLRGIENPYTFLMKNGFVSQTAWNLANNQIGHIKPAQMERLCLLLHCTPNDLFEWRADANMHGVETHPLKALAREKPSPHISELVKDLPVEKMSELEEIIKNLKNAE